MYTRVATAPATAHRMGDNTEVRSGQFVLAVLFVKNAFELPEPARWCLRAMSIRIRLAAVRVIMSIG